jgi:hypothetical protein
MAQPSPVTRANPVHHQTLSKPQIIRSILSHLVGVEVRGSIHFKAVFDDENQRYQVIASGWEDSQQVLQVIVFIEIQGDLIWVHKDNSDYGVVAEMLAQGIDRLAIVLGFQAPEDRHDSGFATGLSV